MATVRTYQVSDAARVIALVRELQAYELGFYERLIQPHEIGPWYMREVEKLCADHGGQALVAEAADGTIVGYALILTDCKNEEDFDEVAFSYAYVTHLVVGKSHRARGVGTLLLDACERLARVAGRDELRVSALAGNAGARRLYERVGYLSHLVTLRKKLA
jgi:ribosomal protein S18 acetylase RimI-like enzyme